MRLADDWELDEWDEVAEVTSVERLPGENRLAKWVVWTALVLVLALMLVIGWVGWWYLGRVQPDDGRETEVVQFTIEEGDTFDDVVARLAIRGLVEDPDVFEWYVDQKGGLVVTPGFYELRTDAHMGDVLAGLRTPPAETYQRITFPEGFTLQQIAERLAAEQPRMSVEAFMQANASAVVPDVYQRPAGNFSLEGLLFPDTYQISNADNEAQVIERMIGLMERVAVNQEDIVTIAPTLGLTPYEVLIVASIIEKEAKLPEDRPKIARVIYNRLYFGMALQIDATVYYGQDRSIPFPELRQIDTPHNTYLHTGLPPTPIANPGRASIQAALHPAPNPPPGDPICLGLADPSVPCLYLYYVLANAEGGHAFAATPEQHQANVDAAAAAGLLG
jgi:UPF0755 protein